MSDDAAAPHGRVSRESLATTQLVARAVERLRDGDREALGFLYARYADNVCGYVRSIVHDEHEAEDLTQQVFAKLVVVIGKYEQREVPFFAWLLRVARNLAVDHIRRQRSVPVEEVRPLASAAANWMDERDRLNNLREAIAQLSPDQQEVLILHHFAGLSPVEIAQRTGRSKGAVHALHHRGRRALTAELAGRGVAPTTMPRQRRYGEPPASASG